MAEPCKRLEDQMKKTEAPPSLLKTQNSIAAATNFTVDPVNFSLVPKNINKLRVLKSWALMNRLVLVELILAITSFSFGSACAGASFGSGTPQVYTIYIGGSGIWAGILCIVAASIGIAAIQQPIGRCLLIPYLVLLIISIVGCAVLIVFSCIWITSLTLFLVHSGFEVVAVLIFNIILVLVSLTLCEWS